MEIAERIVHPDYEVARTLNDIALLKLKDPLDLAKHTPACFHGWKKWEPGNPVPRLFFFFKNSEIWEQKIGEEIRRNSGEDYQIWSTNSEIRFQGKVWKKLIKVP